MAEAAKLLRLFSANFFNLHCIGKKTEQLGMSVIKKIQLGRLLILSAVFSAFFSSCNMNEINEIKIETHPKLVVPLAYGSINISTLTKYLFSNELDFSFDENGYYSFEQVFTQLSTSDTIAFDGALLENVSDGELLITTTNHLPMGTDIDLLFVDSTFSQIGDPVACSFTKPAKVNNEGKVIESTKHTDNVSITKLQMQQYKNAKSVIMLINIFLSENGSDQIYFHKDDFLSLNIGLVVNISTGE